MFKIDERRSPVFCQLQKNVVHFFIALIVSSILCPSASLWIESYFGQPWIRFRRKWTTTRDVSIMYFTFGIEKSSLDVLNLFVMNWLFKQTSSLKSWRLPNWVEILLSNKHLKYCATWGVKPWTYHLAGANWTRKFHSQEAVRKFFKYPSVTKIAFHRSHDIERFLTHYLERGL